MVVTFLLGWPTLAINAGLWVFNLTRKFPVGTVYFPLQCAFLRMDWRYPTASLPLRLGCISLDMTYNEVSAYDVLWFASHTILGAKVCLRSVVSDRMGEPAGRAITAVDTVYVALFSSAVGFLAIGWLARSSLRNGCLAFAAVSPGGRKRVRRTKLRHRRRNSPPPPFSTEVGRYGGGVGFRLSLQ